MPVIGGAPMPEGRILAAAVRGDERELLEAMRDRVARELDSDALAARDLAALTKRLREIVAEIKALTPGEEESTVVSPQEDAPLDPATV
ncbi:hypothetical protein HMPREF1550_00208 [Actinomyces sp. oral taxon 877 str. F0543]|nr:hypothetical protein HMPREF1550_00208 [Actinomyces sp. oral taxon 877 str. F0543]